MPEQDIIEFAHNLIDAEKWPELSSLIADWHPADISSLIRLTPDDQQKQVFHLVGDAAKADVLSELESSEAAEEILSELSNHELSEIVVDMAPDDAADILGELPEDRSEQVLELMEAEDSRDVRRLLQYKEDTAGGIMTSDFVSLRGSETAARALDQIAHMDEREKFYVANVVDEHGILQGYVEVWDLLREPNRQRPLSEIMEKQFIAAEVNMDQEEVANLMGKYDLDVIPVVDEAGVLVGRITSDDVMDVIEAEASEDIFRLAGSNDTELESTGLMRSCAARLPWLVITLLGGCITSIILNVFHERIHDIFLLAAFVPIVLAMGGNAGIQSSTLVVRSLALGHIQRGSVPGMLGREILAGGLMGLICGALLGLWALLMMKLGPADSGPAALSVALVVGIALFAAMTFAALFGAFVPTLLSRFRIDPAVASGPFVTITNDIAALLIYYGITVLLIYSVA